MPIPLTHTLPSDDVTVQLDAAHPRLVSIEEKEALIRSGVSYGELLTPERPPAAAQTDAYHAALSRNGPRTGHLLAALTADLLRTYPHPVLVSLARAGTPVGCAMRRLARRWGRDLPHHTLSIIRGSGIDRIALAAVQAAHPGAQLIFVDGWTGKGSIHGALRGSLPADVPPILAVLSDPAGVARHAATHGDLLLPHAALNATVCGLLSRTFVAVPGQRHAARTEDALRPHDLSGHYLRALDALSAPHGPDTPLTPGPRPRQPVQAALRAAAALGVHDPHRVKPGVGEATRVFLRRRPAHLILRGEAHPDIQHLLTLARHADVPVTQQPDLPYLAVATIAGGAE
ncbi:cysteine protease StiP domain-containing protein [Deinococcus depolymerans]|uniref:Tellurite-like stress resistance cysteine protease StiP n=1 Tax=Deinococcus depolymerans TaxID=392408 RepID=A0ABP3M7U5_9DEIO